MFSKDEGSARMGGELEYYGRTQLDPAFANVAFSLTDPKKVSKVVQSEYGYHIIQLIDKRGDKIKVRHILRRPEVDPKDVEACINEPHYKTVSAVECLPQLTNLNKYTKEVWQELIRAHLSKMNYLVNDVFDQPAKLETQNTIFAKQLEKHINHKCPEVAVLSAFPVYVLDYFGVEGVRRKLNE